MGHVGQPECVEHNIEVAVRERQGFGIAFNEARARVGPLCQPDLRCSEVQTDGLGSLGGRSCCNVSRAACHIEHPVAWFQARHPKEFRNAACREFAEVVMIGRRHAQVVPSGMLEVTK